MTVQRPRTQPCRVLLVDEARSLDALAAPLFHSRALTSVAGAVDPVDALSAAIRFQPDVILLELGRTAEPALDAVEDLMAERPTPILVLHSEGSHAARAFAALKLGALDVMPRPLGPSGPYWRQVEERLLLLAQIRVVQHVKGKRRGRAAGAEPPRLPVIAIGASLGGPRAILVLLRGLPHSLAAPIVVCQHIGPGFSGGLAAWLSAECARSVTEAEDGESLLPGRVYVAPAGRHLTVDRHGAARLDDGPPRGGFKPSCDALFRSVADAFGPSGTGVVLTGMGSDGARGLLELRRRGGYVIAQNEATSVVFSMPKEAIALGAVDAVLPLEEIAASLVRRVGA